MEEASGRPAGSGRLPTATETRPAEGARRAPTLKHVAALAGVSTATVARVLHNKGPVAADTRRAVEAAIRDSGYRLNVVAQGLRKRRTFALGHVMQTTALNPFFAGVAVGAELEAERFGCGVLVYNTERDPDRERRGVEMLIQRRVDAILFTTPTSDRNVELAIEAGIPVVQVERVGPAPTHTVTVNNYVGSRAAIEHLIALGHRRIAFLGVDPRPPGDETPGKVSRRSVERERFGGFADAMAAAGIAPPPGFVSLGETYYSPEHAAGVAARWFALPRGEQPTAIFAGCDILAAGVLQEAYRAGLRVPDDLSIVGFDDTYAPYLTPALTTVEQPVYALGQAAIRLAMAALEDDGEDVIRTERLATTLVVRCSTGPAPVY